MSDRNTEQLATVRPMQARSAEPRVNFTRRRSIIREFALNTSTHGIPGIARGHSKYNRIFWTISLLIFTGIMLFFIVSSISDYLKYPTQTLVSLAEDSKQPFAAVTVCSYSSIRFDRFMEPFLRYSYERNITADIALTLAAQLQYTREFFADRVNRNQSVKEFFYSLGEFLIDCNYNGMDCSAADFVSFQTSDDGLCHTFNAKTNRIRNGSVFSVTENGEDGVLILQLYAHGDEYNRRSLRGRAFFCVRRKGIDPLLLCRHWIQSAHS